VTLASPFPGWEVYMSQFVHPVKVAMVEALLFIGEPLSAAQFAKLFSGTEKGFREPNIRYHLHHLVKLGVLEIVPPGPFSEGSGMERFVYFSSVAFQSDS
jgi:hypothetical protein